MVKKIVAGLMLLSIMLLVAFDTVSATYVSGYHRSNGTYVQPHYRSNPNGLRYDNYSYTPSQGRYNDTYYDNSYSPSWRTPSWEDQDDYYVGLESYRYNHRY